MQALVLASTSIYRKELLGRLGLPFVTVAPDVNESPLEQETPQQLVRRLAESKARAVAAQYPDALIIGSDQVAVVDGRILGKPGDHAHAAAQLRMAAGRRLEFLTGLCLFNTASGHAQVDDIVFGVVFRALTERQIDNYQRHEQPYFCAGSLKSESLGFALCERFGGGGPAAGGGRPRGRRGRGRGRGGGT